MKKKKDKKGHRRSESVAVVGHLLASQFGGEDSRGNFVKSKGGRLSELHVASLL